MSQFDWHHSDGEETFGPMPLSELLEKIRSGAISENDSAWNESLDDWIPVTDVVRQFGGPQPKPRDVKKAAKSNAAVKTAATADDARKVPKNLLDLRPVLSRTDSNVIQSLENQRDQIFKQLTAVCRKEGIEALVLKSTPYAPAVWVKFECWVPHSENKQITDRSAVTLTLIPRPFHERDFEIDIQMQDGLRQRLYQGVIDLTEDDIQSLVLHLVRRSASRRPKFKFRRVRKHPLQLWRPANRVRRLRQDTYQTVQAGLITIGMMLILSIFLAPIGALLLFIGIGIAIWSSLFRSAYVLSSGKPRKEPRNLAPYEYWRTLIPGIGYRIDEIKRDVLDELQSCADSSIQIAEEKIWYWGLDHIVDREQIVATLQRAVGYIHLYRYQNDLFVGWDTHLNWATWMESQTAAGIDRETGELVRVQTIVSATQRPNEYDLVDCSCLSEWIHGTLRRLVKRYMEEAEVDLELDFTIRQRDSDQSNQDPGTRDNARTGLLAGVSKFFNRKA